MATIYVDTDATGAANGTDWANAYTTLAAADAALPNPFTENITIECRASSATADTAAVALAIDTTADYRLTIHGDGTYVLSLSDGDSCSIPYVSGDTAHITIDGVRFVKASMSANYQSLITIGLIRAGLVRIINCDLLGTSTATYRERLIIIGHAAGYAATVALVNNTVTGRSSVANTASSLIHQVTDVATYVYNNTLIGYKPVYATSTNSIWLNNIIKSTVVGDAVGASSDYNMFSGAFDFGGANDDRSQTFTFTNEGAFDYTLNSADTGAINKGTSLAADGNYAFSTDKAGATRSGTWDAGAYEYIAAGGGIVPIMLAHNHFSGGF